MCKYSWKTRCKWVITLLLTAGCWQANAQNEVVITAKAGQTVNLQASYQDNDVLLIQGGGTAASPAVVDGGGKTVLTGNNQLYLLGKYIIVQNIKVQNPNLVQGIRSVVSFRYKKTTGNNCTLSNVQFVQDPGQVSPHSYSWLEVFGQNNTVTGCLFKGKTNRNPIVHVDVDDDQPDNNTLANNTFTDVPVHPGEALEAIRVGLGHGVSGAVIKDNVFRRCFGDSETLSCKSSGNTMSGNYFVDCRSGISLRGGNNDIVTDNRFYNTKNALRMAGSGHKITNNYFFNAPVSTSNGGLVLMVGGDPKGCGYGTVENITIEDNVFVNHLGLRVLKAGEQCTEFPRNIVFRQNRFMNAKQVFELKDTSVADFGPDITKNLNAPAAQALSRAAGPPAKKVSPETQRLTIETYQNGKAMFSNCDFGASFFSPNAKGNGEDKSKNNLQDIQQKINEIRGPAKDK